MASKDDGEKAKTYETYLQLENVLVETRRLSVVNNDPSHEEHLFIIVHQAFEIWFKQILFDFDSLINLFKDNSSNTESGMATIVTRLDRCKLIFKLVIGHFEILETMAPLLFLEFRCHLGNASGFQSEQFRKIEIKLGLKEDDRVEYNKKNYIESLQNPDSINRLKKETQGDTLLNSVQHWLEKFYYKDFFTKYEKAVERSISKEQNEKKKAHEKQFYDAILSEENYNADMKERKRRLSYKAFIAGLTISMKRDEPGYSLPCQIISLLTDIDNLIMQWRHRHVQMVHRMIGNKIGTGGSSGYSYLNSTVIEAYRVFVDFSNLSTYLIPRKELQQDQED